MVNLLCRPTARAARSVPYLILLQKGFALTRVVSGAPVGSCPAFSPSRPLSGLRCLFLWHFPSRRFARRPRPVEAGFPPCGVRTFLCCSAATGHSHVASGEIFKDQPTRLRRGRGFARTSCTPRSTAACRPRHSLHWRPQADQPTAAARDGSHRRRHRA